MARQINFSILAEGFVATSPADIFLAVEPTAVKSVTLFNTNAASQTVFLYLHKSGGTRRKVRRFVLAQNESGEYDPASLSLAVGDSIDADTTTGSAVDMTVQGGEIVEAP